jgi:hypothetical protein
MMPPPLYGVWLWFRSNPAAQWAAGIGAAYVLFRVWLSRKIGAARQEAATEAREEVIDQIEEQTDDAIQRVQDERDATRALNEQQLLDLAAKSPNNRGRVQNPAPD